MNPSKTLAASKKAFQCIVVGGGHAGCEAAAASARSGASTLLLTHKRSTIGEMSCNPSFGGIGKGHLLREIDALDGICPRICDKSAITYQALNRGAGPAVLGLRAQIDRKLYKKFMQKEIFEEIPNLDVYEGAVEDLYLEQPTSPNGIPKVKGVILADGRHIYSDCVVITTGTFLSAEIYKGNVTTPAGRIGDAASYGLSKTFSNVGFRLGRLRTGTPPRLIADSIDFSKFELMPPDEKPIMFSFLNKEPWLAPEKQYPTYLGYTNPTVAELVMKYVKGSKHVAEEINGPRYCPSLEAKVLRFENLKHRLFLEHEGLDSNIIYPQGMSMTFDDEIQLAIMRSIPGLEKCEIVQAGYGVHYDFVNPQQLKTSLETKLINGLFLAGQINGTTGYEEAAAQGLLAGLNASLKSQQKDLLTLDRSQAYLGVLIDDLTSLGTNEPYRMFTSRAEFRLHLRPDNADLRLTQIGRDFGVVNNHRFGIFSELREKYETCKKRLDAIKFSLPKWCQILDGFQTKASSKTLTAFEMLSRHNIALNELAKKFPSELGAFSDDDDLAYRISSESRYAIEHRRLIKKVDEMREELKAKLPDSLDYSKITEINLECREKLANYRPQNIAAASRVPGVTPDVLITLLRYAKRAPVFI
uniref:Protein MTO1 homolog, mitochondrial n=1 Tax=Panagrolaimus superbus TaxID=310955 RepID=A0A914YFU5_9BILA